PPRFEENVLQFLSVIQDGDVDSGIFPILIVQFDRVQDRDLRRDGFIRLPVMGFNLDQPTRVMFTEGLKKISPYFRRNIDFGHRTPAEERLLMTMLAQTSGRCVDSIKLPNVATI